MSAGKTCSECGAPMPAGSPNELCGRCLFGLGLGDDPGNQLSAQPEGGAFPQLQGSSASELPGTNQGAVQPPQVSEKSGDRIGRYKLLQQIGEGGFGVVYMAQQQ